MPGRFEGKRVLITGGSSGIGAELGRQFAAEGACVALTARSEDRLSEVADSIKERGGEALAIACDVTDRASVDAAVSQTVSAFGGLDIAVINAGFGVTGKVTKLTTEDYRRQFETNVFGAIETMYACLPHLIESRGQLVFVSSVLGKLGRPIMSPYVASKFALCGFAESIGHELASDGVSVTCINPGMVESNFRRVSNENIYDPDSPETAPKFLIVPTAKAVKEMLNAIEKRKPEATITFHGKFAVFLSGHFPRTFRWAVRKVMGGRETRY